MEEIKIKRLWKTSSLPNKNYRVNKGNYFFPAQLSNELKKIENPFFGMKAEKYVFWKKMFTMVLISSAWFDLRPPVYVIFLYPLNMLLLEKTLYQLKEDFIVVGTYNEERKNVDIFYCIYFLVTAIYSFWAAFKFFVIFLEHFGILPMFLHFFSMANYDIQSHIYQTISIFFTIYMVWEDFYYYEKLISYKLESEMLLLEFIEIKNISKKIEKVLDIGGRRRRTSSE